MEAVSRAFFETTERAGLVIGVLPASAPGSTKSPSGYPNPFVELPIRTHLHKSGTAGTELESRNHINVLSSDVVIALEGAWGTQSEVTLAVQYGRPVIAYLREPTAIPQLPETVPIVSRLEELQGFVRRALGRAP